MKLHAIISYNGKNFYGYQIQKIKSQRSVQEEIQKVLSKIFNQEVVIYASGRTDRGVHALGQSIHFVIQKDEIDLEKMKYAINKLLPSDIHFNSLEIADEDFHARFSCISKQYRYIINLGEYNPLHDDLIYNLNKPLDMDLIQQAMSYFIGTHSFINFCTNTDGDYIRTIYSFTIERKDDYLIFNIIGNGFRRYMVRMIIGSLIQVGLKKIAPEEIKRLLNTTKMERTCYKAPSNGLYLVKVNYGGNDNDTSKI